MPKGYWIAHVAIDDPEAYETYRQANARAFAKYQGVFLVRGGQQEVREGDLKARSVILEFPSYEAAKACYDSPEYQEAKALREQASLSDTCIVEGYAP